MERLDKIDSGDINTGLSRREILINATNFLTKFNKTGEILKSAPMVAHKGESNIGSYSTIGYKVNTCQSPQAVMGDNSHDESDKLSIALQIAVEGHRLAKIFESANQAKAFSEDEKNIKRCYWHF